jgi:hypothetical protein
MIFFLERFRQRETEVNPWDCDYHFSGVDHVFFHFRGRFALRQSDSFLTCR